MNRIEDTVRADMIRWYANEWSATAYFDGEKAYDEPLFIEGKSLDIDGPVTIEFDEYFTTVKGDFHLTISYVEREWEGEPYGEDYRLDEIEIVE